MTQADEELNSALGTAMGKALVSGNPKLIAMVMNIHADKARDSFYMSFGEEYLKAGRIAEDGIVDIENYLRTNNFAKETLGFILALYYLARANAIIPLAESDIDLKREALRSIKMALQVANLPSTLKDFACQTQSELEQEIF